MRQWGVTPRLFVAATLFSAWLVLLLRGFAGGGSIHLLLAVALVVFPWAALRAGPAVLSTQPSEEDP